MHFMCLLYVIHNTEILYYQVKGTMPRNTDPILRPCIGTESNASAGSPDPVYFRRLAPRARGCSPQKRNYRFLDFADRFAGQE